LKNKLLYFKIIITFFFSLLSTNTVQSQDFGANLVSSYVWRGTQFGSGTHIQPWMKLGKEKSGVLSGGIWGSFPTTANGGGNELDLWVSYDLGPVVITVTNYSFPNKDGTYGVGNPGLFDVDWMEISGSSEFGPIKLNVGYFTNAEALYVETSFPTGPIDIGIGFGSDNKDAFYAGGYSGLVNLSFSGSKKIKISEDYSLPLFGSFIYNPNNESAFLVFGTNF